METLPSIGLIVVPPSSISSSKPGPRPSGNCKAGRGQLENYAIAMLSLSLIDLKSASRRE